MLSFFLLIIFLVSSYFFFFFNDTATTEIYTLSLHDALPICGADTGVPSQAAASDANFRERGPLSDLAWQREAREERGWPGGRAWPLLLITIIAVLYPFEYDTGLTNYSLGDAVVGPVALFVVLRSLVGRLVGWPRYTVQLLALVVVAIASSLANAFSPAIYFSASSALGETAKLFSAGLWMCVMFWLLSDDFSRGFYQLACSSALLATGFAVSSLWVTVRETSDYRPTGPFGNTNLYASYLCLNVFLVLGSRA